MPVNVEIAHNLVASYRHLAQLEVEQRLLRDGVRDLRTQLWGKKVQVIATEPYYWHSLEDRGSDGVYNFEELHGGEHVREGRFVHPSFCMETEICLRVISSDRAFDLDHLRYYRIKAEHVHQMVEYPQ